MAPSINSVMRAQTALNDEDRFLITAIQFIQRNT